MSLFARLFGGEAREVRARADALDRMEAEAAARVEEVRRETALRDEILSSMNEGVILADGDAVVYANPAARRLFGVEELRILPPGLPLPAAPSNTVPTDTSQSGVPSFSSSDVASRGATRPAVGEIVLHYPVYRELRCASARVSGGKLLVVAQDVTEAKRIDRIRRDFVANASHEMKTPVAGILATAETLRTAIREDPAAAERFAQTLATEAARLSRLVQDLLDLARLEQPGGEAASVVLSDVVREVVAATAARAAEGGVTIRSEVEPSVEVRGRSEDLAVLVRNLLDNAVAHTPDGGAVTVRLRARDDTAVLEVADTGRGIPAKDLPRIFERFYRVDAARARTHGGTGLGLAIVRHVAESHGGTVSATSELGAGSTFTVRLPLRSA